MKTSGTTSEHTYGSVVWNYLDCDTSWQTGGRIAYSSSNLAPKCGVKTLSPASFCTAAGKYFKPPAQQNNPYTYQGNADPPNYDSSYIPGLITYDPHDYCLSCPMGRASSNTHTTVCTDCTFGKYMVEDRTVCDDCPKGFRSTKDSENVECVACEAGLHSNKGSGECKNCENVHMKCRTAQSV